MWAFNRRVTIRALINQTKSSSIEERGLTNLERERAREGRGQNWLTMNLLYSYKLSTSQDIKYPPLFDPSPSKACRDVENSNSRRRVENRGRKTYQVQGNSRHQAQVATFLMEPAEGARQ